MGTITDHKSGAEDRPESIVIKAKRVSLFLPDLRGGGAEKVSVDLANEFVRRGYRVDMVLISARGQFLEALDGRVTVIDLGCNRLRDVIWPLRRYLDLLKPEALVAAMWPLTSIATFARALSSCKCKLVVAEHGILSAKLEEDGVFQKVAARLTTAVGYRLADAVVGVSDGVSSDMADLACLDTSQVVTIHNPVPIRPSPSEKDIAEAAAAWGSRPTLRLLTVGSMKAVKDHELLLRSFADLRKRLDAGLVIVGEGELKGRLIRLAGDLGIADDVTFAGFRQDPTPFYHAADLFVLSSRNEGLPTVLIEALAAGLPVVSTDCVAGPSEILKGGLYGRLVPVGAKDDLAEAMYASLHQRHDREALIDRARDFSVEKAATRYEELLFPALRQ